MPNPNNTKPPPQHQGYSISLYDIHLRSGTTLVSPQQPIITEVEDTSAESVNVPTTHVPPTTKEPPFPSRLAEPTSLVENQAMLDLLEQLKQITVKISSLDALKEVPVYTKAIKEACIK
jgi:hypothetical protein